LSQTYSSSFVLFPRLLLSPEEAEEGAGVMFVVCVLAERERKIHSTHAQKVELSDSFFFMTERHFFLLAPSTKTHKK